MRLRQYAEMNEMISNPFFTNVVKTFKSLSLNQAVEKFKDAWKELKDIVSKDEEIEKGVLKIINKHMDTDYNSFDDVSARIQESTILNEDAKHWWDVIKREAFPTMAFYPALQCWLEIDKYLKGNGFDTKYFLVYAVFWALLVSGKYVAEWAKWKKENPEQYKKEKLYGSGGII